ncbi:uncharacterized protein PHALS_01619 [Plasmopara halstedii]|uniref:Uncharacterized protein n=1 Tax=Plasmopara halstedii TaxID=4781 RepID=A0A0P1ASW0_PLAHL|nr:uncharacterized protein PHALS_01619 [Plasmopara halstedii]CEG45314.1 hypothetical protein PHALS_01619 [Plasmopara halstedii]|eukprot:XP_024581683.1 hypothetical protein PHALS_01619 [Plasmopara halstedii]
MTYHTLNKNDFISFQRERMSLLHQVCSGVVAANDMDHNQLFSDLLSHKDLWAFPTRHGSLDKLRTTCL